MIITVFSTKGGVAKTTIADELAYIYAQRNGPDSVSFLQLDQQPGSLSDTVKKPGSTITITDTPGRVDPQMNAVLAASDVVVVPLLPGPKQVSPLEGIMRTVRKSDSKVLFVLSKFSAQRRADLRTLSEITTRFPGVLLVTIPETTLVEVAGFEGKTISEYTPLHKTARAFGDVARIAQELGDRRA